MKMNFIGFHTYPFSSTNEGFTTGKNEPTVWVGTKDELNPETGAITVNGSYVTSYANSMRGEWSETALSTSQYKFGTSKLFESDCWPTFVEGSCPYPHTVQQSNALFEYTSTMLEQAFQHGKLLGVESCVGTETPLSTPPHDNDGNICNPVLPVKGCYQDSTTRLFPYTVTISDSRNSQEWCATECARSNFTYAAVEYGVACFCGSELPVPTKRIQESKCETQKCAGNQSEYCGGSYTMIVFQVSCPHGLPKPSPTKQDYYEGIFTRLTKVMPSLDWYWIWTPETWEWNKVTVDDPVFTDTMDDLAAAMSARQIVEGFENVKMATNGWVVGPLPDRTIFDKMLPETWDAITSIDLNTGHHPVDPSYENITRHAKWVIPWMEV